MRSACAAMAKATAARGSAQWSVKDFSDDLAWAIEQIGGPVAVVGHSMGGGVAQYYLRQGRKMAGLVLMASVPPHGLLRASMSMYNRNPKLWEELQKTRSGRLTDADFAIVEKGLLSEPLTSQTRKAMLRRLNEPAIQASIELMGWHPIAPLAVAGAAGHGAGRRTRRVHSRNRRDAHRPLLWGDAVDRAGMRACHHAGAQLGDRGRPRLRVADPPFRTR